MLSLLSKIWLKYKKIIFISLKLHQISTNQSITYQNYIWTKHIIFPREETQSKTPKTAPAEAATASAEAVTAPVKLQTAPTEAETPSAEAETPSAEAETVPTHSALAPTMVPEKSHKAYLTIFSQIMNLMPYTFLQANDVIRMTSSNYNSCD